MERINEGVLEFGLRVQEGNLNSLSSQRLMEAARLVGSGQHDTANPLIAEAQSLSSQAELIGQGRTKMLGVLEAEGLQDPPIAEVIREAILRVEIAGVDELLSDRRFVEVLIRRIPEDIIWEQMDRITNEQRAEAAQSAPVVEPAPVRRIEAEGESFVGTVDDLTRAVEGLNGAEAVDGSAGGQDNADGGLPKGEGVVEHRGNIGKGQRAILAAKSALGLVGPAPRSFEDVVVESWVSKEQALDDKQRQRLISQYRGAVVNSIESLLERLYGEPASFKLNPPKDLREFMEQIRQDSHWGKLTRDQMRVVLLREPGFEQYMPKEEIPGELNPLHYRIISRGLHENPLGNNFSLDEKKGLLIDIFHRQYVSTERTAGAKDKDWEVAWLERKWNDYAGLVGEIVRRLRWLRDTNYAHSNAQDEEIMRTLSDRGFTRLGPEEIGQALRREIDHKRARELNARHQTEGSSSRKPTPDEATDTLTRLASGQS